VATAVASIGATVVVSRRATLVRSQPA
jgi:hypothetical protein